MKATILCPGPSLARTFSGGADLTIGVNRAAVGYACDWWAAFDSPLILDPQHTPAGKPWLFTSADTAASLARHRSPWALQTEAIAESLFVGEQVPKNWTLFTAPAALVLAAHLGATRIDVYGADWTSGADFDGVMPTSDRSPARWSREIPIWSAVVEWLDARGVQVKTHGNS